MAVRILAPLTPDTPIWRYMDLPKFISLLGSYLYFCRPDRLGDPMEAPFPSRVRSLDDFVGMERERLFEALIDEAVARALSDQARRWAEGSLALDKGQYLDEEQLRAIYRRDFGRARARSPSMPIVVDPSVYIRGRIAALAAKRFHVSCWHANTDESAALWKIYLAADQGVAVRSTVGRLAKCLESSDPNANIHICDAIYIRPREYELSRFQSPLDVLRVKRKSFEHEREVRAILEPWADPRWLEALADSSGISAEDRPLLQLLDLTTSPLFGVANTDGTAGFRAPGVEAERLLELMPAFVATTPPGRELIVPFTGLVTQVHVPPLAPAHFESVIRSLCQRYGADSVPVRRSEMDDPL